LKRHIERKHFGRGKPILKYLSGNLIYNPVVTPGNLIYNPVVTPGNLIYNPVVTPGNSIYNPVVTPGNSIYNPVVNPPHRYVLQNEYPIFKASSTGPFFYSSTEHKPDTDYLFDTNFKHIFQFMELLNKIKSRYAPSNPVIPIYFSPPAPQSYNSLKGNTVYVRFDDKSQYQSKVYRNYEGVTGFRADICQNCFATLIIRIGGGPENKIEHKCYPNGIEAVKRLGFLEYAIDYLTEVNKIPEVLFQECRAWSNNTTGRLYLIATKIQQSVEGRYEIQENYEALQFLKALAEQKMLLNDMGLFKFLKFAKKSTSTFVTVKGKPGEENSNYMISVSNV
jgi:hypothetical protein